MPFYFTPLIFCEPIRSHFSVNIIHAQIAFVKSQIGNFSNFLWKYISPKKKRFRTCCSLHEKKPLSLRDFFRADYCTVPTWQNLKILFGSYYLFCLWILWLFKLCILSRHFYTCSDISDKSFFIKSTPYYYMSVNSMLQKLSDRYTIFQTHTIAMRW